MEILAPHRPDRHKTIGAGFVQFDKQAKALHARNPARKFRPHPIRQEGRQIPIRRISFRHHRAAFGIGNQLCGFIEIFNIPWRQPIIAPTMPRDKRAMHHQIGIAPDGRGEVGVIPQSKAEMAKVYRRVIGLGHRAQRGDVHQFVEIGALSLGQQPVQMRCFQHQTFGQSKARRLGHFAQRVKLFGAGFFMHAKQHRAFEAEQVFGRRDVGGDHVFLDQLMRIEPVAVGDRQNHAFVRQHDFAFGQIKVKRLTPRAGQFQCLIGRIKRAQNRVEQGVGNVIAVTVDGILNLTVVQTAVRPHQAAHKSMADLGAGGVKAHLNRQTRAVYVFMQRAQIARQHIGQHRHNAVGKIAAVATLAGLTVQSRSGADVMGDICDGHPDDMTAGVLGVGIRAGINRIIAVAGIDGVDGYKRQRAQVFPRAKIGRQGCVSFGNHRIGELIGNAVLVDRNQRHRTRARGITQARRNAGLRQAQTFRADLFSLDQLAIKRATHIIARHRPFLVRALVDGQNATTFCATAKDPQQFGRVRPDAADQPRFIGVIHPPHRGQAGQNAFACAQGGIVFLRHNQDARGVIAQVFFHRLGKEIARCIRGQHQQHANWRQSTRRAQVATAFFDAAGDVRIQLAQQAFEVDACIPLDAKGVGDVAFAGQTGIINDPLADLINCGKWFHRLPLACNGKGEKPPRRRSGPKERFRTATPFRGGRCLHPQRPGQPPQSPAPRKTPRHGFARPIWRIRSPALCENAPRPRGSGLRHIHHRARIAPHRPGRFYQRFPSR